MMFLLFFFCLHHFGSLSFLCDNWVLGRIYKAKAVFSVRAVYGHICLLPTHVMETYILAWHAFQRWKILGVYLSTSTLSFVTFYVTSLISASLRLSFIALLSCLFKLCSLQPTGCRGHFDAKSCEYTMVSLQFCQHYWGKKFGRLFFFLWKSEAM